MDLAQGEIWLRDTARIEAGEPIEAGLAIKAYRQLVDGLSGESAQPLRQQMQIQALLFTALRQWMETWDLGAGFEETYTIARGLVRQHLADSVQLQQVVESLRGEDASTEAQAILSQLFTADDWQRMAEVAARSIASQVLRAGQPNSAGPAAERAQVR